MSASTLGPEGPFSGLLIIDMTHVLAGPFGTNIFNDLGARVIKIAAGLGQMPGNVVIIGRADPVEQQSARALSLASIAHTRVSHL
jgi:crotonobetainyl-CoA:carnitine CoA-transferase CaiB-like acyl-CoA transferase